MKCIFPIKQKVAILQDSDIGIKCVVRFPSLPQLTYPILFLLLKINIRKTELYYFCPCNNSFQLGLETFDSVERLPFMQ